ncbi:MAG: hypothetical protein HQL64_16870 [Magnetococcales bacterium]|nr:hypothetical protein [Magnetococcales bacterium]
MNRTRHKRLTRHFHQLAILLGVGGLLSALLVGAARAEEGETGVPGIRFHPPGTPAGSGVNQRQTPFGNDAVSARSRAEGTRQGLGSDTSAIDGTVDGLVNDILDSHGIPRERGSSANQALDRAKGNRTQGPASGREFETVQKVIQNVIQNTPDGGKIVTKKVQLSNGQIMETKTVIQKSVQTSTGRGSKACSSIGSLGDSHGDCNQ